MSVFSNRSPSSPDQARAYTAAVLDLLGARNPLEVLRDTPDALRGALEGLSREQATEPEAPGKWSIRHVVQHLADSELVGGYRFRMVLAQDRPPLTGYDQDLWAERLEYGQSNAEQALDEFAVLRRANLRLLQRASDKDLERVGVHAERGEETLGHLVRLYAGHDLLHLRQLDRIRHLVTKASTV